MYYSSQREGICCQLINIHLYLVGLVSMYGSDGPSIIIQLASEIFPNLSIVWSLCLFVILDAEICLSIPVCNHNMHKIWQCRRQQSLAKINFVKVSKNR